MGDLLVHALHLWKPHRRSARALHRCRRGLGWGNLGNYYALLASLTQLNNLEACFLTGIPMVFEKPKGPGHASIISPVSPMAGTIWQPI